MPVTRDRCLLDELATVLPHFRKRGVEEDTFAKLSEQHSPDRRHNKHKVTQTAGK